MPLPAAKLVEQVTLTVKHMRQFFPDLRVGDIDVVAEFDHGLDWHNVIAGYTRSTLLFEKATGTKLAFFHCDIAWRTNWRPVIAPLAKAMRGQEIRFKSIIGGTPRDMTDQAFVETGPKRLRELEANLLPGSTISPLIFGNPLCSLSTRERGRNHDQSLAII